ncbi:nucleotide sugar dehydrogenase family protein [Candidatus Endolissoclinum faulkneri L2]|uniref:UDP-glucose 6-dehydrogenase n=1 Tax=Candidatus Endolissoclinum faulkneri L2 TaxID=1193729 RepID=K7YP13_9PROT|nr:UDP-glucose/GDP-mannose dehydrogenase family protein [Candidatus Endolissoclinum faulkneri]AFX98339.1 nucleotide sugar dehydrogenase family protein [Candidatus Endolissoclinum faulkneri L2]
MRIAIIGVGYVGLVTGACFSEFGVEVVCVDKDVEKIRMLQEGKISIFEPGLEDLVVNNVKAWRLFFTTDIAEGVSSCDAVFIAVGTPPSRLSDGHADLSFVYSAATEIADNIAEYTVIITKSTVPVGTSRKVEHIIRERCPNCDFDVCSNPEFLREGVAIDDFMHPDRVVIGASNDRSREVMRQIYRPLLLTETPIFFTELETSEMIKYASNTFLATKITFINEMADLCERMGVDVHEVALGIGLDDRIGHKFLHPGPGYGGSCLPKDAMALIKTAQHYDSPLRIIETVVDINSKRKKAMAARIVDAIGGSVAGKTITLLGLTFKSNTDDLRNSPALDIVPELVKAGAIVHGYDPEGIDEAIKLLPEIKYYQNAYEAMDGADAVAIITEWSEFRALDVFRIKSMLKTPVMIDLRNIYDPQVMKDVGITYICIGRNLQSSSNISDNFSEA